MPTVTLPDGSTRSFDQTVTVLDVAADIGPGLARAALAGKVAGELVDTSFPIAPDAELAIITSKSDEALELMRLASFLMWIGGLSGAFGQYTVPNWTLAHRDYVLDLFEEMTGARIYHMYIVPGGVRAGLPVGHNLADGRAYAMRVGLDAEDRLGQLDRAALRAVGFVDCQRSHCRFTPSSGRRPPQPFKTLRRAPLTLFRIMM